MKKLVPIVLVIMILAVQVFIPCISYAYEIVEENKTHNNIETEKEENKIENKVEGNTTNKIENNTTTENSINQNNTNKTESNNIINNNTNKIESNTTTDNTVEEQKENKVEEEKIQETENKEKEELAEEIKLLKENEKLEEGTYKILMATNPKQSLTVDGGKTANGANVHLWEYLDTPQQQFKIKYDKEGYCEIIPVHSEKRLDVVGWGNEANIDQWEENGGSDNQKWIIKKSERGNYNIVSKRQNLYLDAYQSKIQNGTNIQAYEKSGGNGQEFKLEKIKEEEKPQKTVEEGTYKIVMAIAPTQSLTIDGGKREDGANVHIWEYVDAPQQQFNLVYDGEGYYEIIPVNSGKRLDVVGWGNEANVDQWGSNGGNDNQKWQIKKSERGNYNIISKRENLYLDAYHSKTEDGTNIEVYEKSGGNGQEFKLEKISNRSEKTIPEGTYKIVPQANKNIVLEASSSNKDNNGKIQIWQDFNAKAQKFKIQYEKGYYKILLGHSGKALTVKDRKIQSGTDVVQYDWNGGDNQKWTIRDNGDGSFGIMPFSNHKLALDIKGPIENGSVMEIYNNEKNIKQKFCFIKSNLGVEIDTNRYPGVGEAIDRIVEKHPNWEFEILYTNLDFNTAVQGEYEYANKRGNLVYTPTYKGDWIAPNPYVDGPWASASYKGIAYFMDTRNFLNDIDAFQFVDLGNYASSGATIDSIRNQVEGTFLNDYVEDIRRLCEKNNLNPYYIIARLFQEQGKDGSATLNMDGGDGKRYFNPFNIGAVVGNDVATALARAKKEGWDSMVKGLEGGMKIVKSGYIDVKQNTLYLNKFDVNPASGGGFYNHQYMQNLSAAYSEASIIRSCYADTNTLDNKIKFIVPVYENMPREFSERPTGQGGNNQPTSDKGPMSVKVVDTQMGLALRTEPSTTGGLIERMPTGTILLSVERLSNGWHKVIAPSGNIGYCSNSNLQIIADESNCNDRVMVRTADGIGTNVRTGPGTSFDLIKAVADGTRGTRIITNKYNYDGYWWDEVIFDDGTKGFVATNYLVKVD